ncbi:MULTISPECIES: thioesterase family protein [Saccharopolyspora]|uniref:Uncharacterized protein n=1 Tax=Saccharopolyspora elongata TaxID=2530387 RepID=A0A4R4XT24_9PSEU|nr:MULTISPECIES: thioesterase family protein [Saccharopolyspora]TDD34109.1 hypothetical protein E1288_44810 [Saccharopolyspora elongata]
MTVSIRALGVHRTRVPLRWRDLDHQGHVYHGTVLTLLDEARTRWLRTAIGVEHPDAYVVARIEIDYQQEILMDHDAAEISIGISRLGHSSIRTAESLTLPGGEQAARAEVVVVMWDQKAHCSRALTADERARAEAVARA